MTEATIQANETTIPMLPCVSVDDTVAFYEMLGFAVTYRQAKPYVYLALSMSGFHLHFTGAPKDLDPAKEAGGCCLVMVDAVAPYHAAFTAAMRAAHGKVLATGQPRITRYRPGASRFTLVDPSGNSVLFIQRDEPMELEYGGSKELDGLARVLDSARILREFKNDDRAAYRTLTSGLRRHGEKAPAVDRALALAALIEVATALGEPERIEPLLEQLRAIALTGPERRRVSEELTVVEGMALWRDGA
ncbi:glyoxalase [Longispora sp. NPDC051575]|uniref:glyoxalase n=1 Tax=Longispora sp. NPDC051575 TaxID=3154943 RepID=UPI003422BDAF